MNKYTRKSESEWGIYCDPRAFQTNKLDVEIAPGVYQPSTRSVPDKFTNRLGY